jgi:DNA repair protein RadC
MGTQLMLIENMDFEADRIAQENRVIDKALLILDRRLFSRGPDLTSPDAVAAYLKLQLAQQEHEVFGVIF